MNTTYFFDALPNIVMGYCGIFVVTAIIVFAVYLLNNIPEKIAQHKKKKEEDDE